MANLGVGWLLADLEGLLEDPASLLDLVQLTEAEPSMLGISPHVAAAADAPAETAPFGARLPLTVRSAQARLTRRR